MYQFYVAFLIQDKIFYTIYVLCVTLNYFLCNETIMFSRAVFISYRNNLYYKKLNSGKVEITFSYYDHRTYL